MTLYIIAGLVILILGYIAGRLALAKDYQAGYDRACGEQIKTLLQYVKECQNLECEDCIRRTKEAQKESCSVCGEGSSFLLGEQAG